MRSLITAQARRAEAIVREHKDAVDALASALVERDVLTAPEVHEIAGAHGVMPARLSA